MNTTTPPKMPTQEEFARMRERIEKNTQVITDEVLDLLDEQRYEEIDARLDAVKTLDAPDTGIEGAEIGYFVGLYVGLLAKTPVRTRSSFRYLLERYQKMVPPGYDVEVILGIKELPS